MVRGEETSMADTVQRVEYFYVEVADRPGEGARVLGVLRDAGVGLLAFSGFPRGRRAQVDFVPADSKAFREAVRKVKWAVTGPKRAFLIQGADRTGAVAEIMTKLADAKINVTAVDAVCAGDGRYGAILWVAPRDYNRAAKALGAT
jgi:hypothetical protein